MSRPRLSYRLVGYFSASAARDQKLDVATSNLPAGQLTHVIYAFATVTGAGVCASVNAQDDQVNFPQLAALKTQNPGLMTLISIGGAGHSANFSTAAATASSRQTLAASCVSFMKTNGFDGIDIDWEFPAAADTANFTALLTALWSALQTQGTADNRTYLLTIAAPAGRSNFANVDVASIYPLLDWFNVMTYDYVVASSKTTGLLAPLFAQRTRPAPRRRTAPKTSMRQSVPTWPLVCQRPRSCWAHGLSAQGWQGVPTTNNGLFQPVTPPTSGTLSVASINFGDLEQTYLPTYPSFWHAQAFVPWLYNTANSGVCISFENATSLAIKANYVISRQLGGVMFWDLNADDAARTRWSMRLPESFRPAKRNLHRRRDSFEPHERAVGGLQVQIVDKNVGGDVVLFFATTGPGGAYSASVVISPSALSAPVRNLSLTCKPTSTRERRCWRRRLSSTTPRARKKSTSLWPPGQLKRRASSRA